jgi:phage tail sheath protein FI
MPEYLSPGVYVEEVPSAVKPIAGVGTSTAGFIGVVPGKTTVPEGGTLAPAHRPVLCTTWGEFTKSFGDFSAHKAEPNLAHAVYGFFNNGGSRCWVARVEPKNGASNITEALNEFEAIDEIALVAAPGLATVDARKALDNHCTTCKDRFAIVDLEKDFDVASKTEIEPMSLYAAAYVPWLEVYDPASEGRIVVPPSGHLAGIYARVDAERGVHKAPANEVVRGALGLSSRISRAQQDGLNPKGVNVIRELSGSIRVWGARTVGGDGNGEWKYISVRRLFLFLRESIDEGTQWVVFEPNDQSLWAKITRNVTAFLTNVWRDGALVGDTPQQAFYVKCDAETNPPEVREAGQVVTEIGVAVVRPAEFVIFRISQWAGSES